MERGWPIVPIPPVNGKPTKGPTEKGWPNHLLEPGTATSVLGKNWNIGLLLRDLTDVDLDCREAREAAKVFLPPTELVYGRRSSPASHWLYKTSIPLHFNKFILPGDKERGDLLELRAMSPANGSKAKAFQSLLPPSVHPTGDQYEWDRYEDAAVVNAELLRRAVHLAAITTAIAKLHPALDAENKTARDEFRLAVSGVLARRLPDVGLKIFTTALRIAGDRKDRSSIFKTTLDKLRRNANVKGIPALAQIVGQPRASAIAGWIDAISQKEQPQSTAASNGHSPASALPVIEDEEEPPAEQIPICPAEAIDGDLIGEITRALTEGTFIPPIFVRENIKVILGAVVNKKVGLRSHPNIHTRAYHMMVSAHPQSGKEESWNRTGRKDRGFLHAFLADAGELEAGMALGAGISLLDGGIFGSGEYMAKILSEPQNKRSIAYWDEMSELFEKDKIQGSIIEKKMLQLFEGGAISQGSFKNKRHAALDVEFSFLGCFTRPSFDRSFTGKGSAGSGMLSRCIFSYADKVPRIGDWGPIDVELVMELRGKLASCLGLIGAHDAAHPYIIEETPDATHLRHEVMALIESLDDRYKPRLADHMKRDLILRAIFSPKPIIDAEKVVRAKLWVQNQYENRFLLWPEDAGSNVERMENIILNTLEKTGHALSENQLARFCNVRRAGSGGFTALHFAIMALIRTGQIKIVGKTRKGFSVYGRVA